MRKRGPKPISNRKKPRPVALQFETSSLVGLTRIARQVYRDAEIQWTSENIRDYLEENHRKSFRPRLKPVIRKISRAGRLILLEDLSTSPSVSGNHLLYPDECTLK